MATTIRLVKSGLFWGALLMFVPATRGLAQPINRTEQEPATIAWPNKEPFQSVGNPTDESTINVPRAVADAAGKVLGGHPSEWHVLETNHFAGQHKHIVLLMHDGHSFRCLVQSNGWYRLNSPQGLPFINAVMHSFFRPTDTLQNASKVAAYIGYVAFVYKYPAAPLTTGFLQQQERSGVNEWLTGAEKNPQVFRSLFYDPVVTRNNDALTLRCNLMTRRGAVEQWTLHAKVTKFVELESIDIVVIRKEGTFNYPYVS